MKPTLLFVIPEGNLRLARPATAAGGRPLRVLCETFAPFAGNVLAVAFPAVIPAGNLLHRPATVATR